MLKIQALESSAATSVLLLTLMLWLWPPVATANERGRVPVNVITMQDLAAPANTNSVTALADGRMLVSNYGALMIFDGVTWRKYRHPLGTGNLSALAFATPNALYAGWQGEFGWFETNDVGDFVWHSLLEKVAVVDRGVGDVTTVLMDRARGGVWYIGNRRVFFWDTAAKSLTKVLEITATTASLVDGMLWLATPDALLTLSSVKPTDISALKPVAGSHVFGPGAIRTVLSDDSGELVVQVHSLYWRAKQSADFLPFASALGARFLSERIADVIRLRNGDWAVLLQNSQILLLSPAGELRAEFGTDDGIAANPAKTLFEDRFGSLWLAQERTLSIVHLGRGITRFDQASGLPGADSLERWNGLMFVGQTRALYRMLPGQGMTPARFERVLPKLASAICMANTFAGKRLFVAGYGLHEVLSQVPGDPSSALSAKQLIDLRVCNRMEASRFVPGRIWLAHTHGLLRVDMTLTGAPVLTPMPQVSDPVDAVAEIDANQLLLSANGSGTWRISAQAGVQLPPISANLPAGPVKLFPGNERPWVLTQQGLWRFNPISEQFEQPSGWPIELKANKIFSILEDSARKLWVRGTDVQGVYLPASKALSPSGYLRADTLDSIDKSRTMFRFLQEGDVVWISRSDDLLRIDLTAQTPFPPVVAPILAGIEDLNLHSPLPYSAMAMLPDAARNFRFSFALPSTLDASKNTYRSRLSSIDADWSPWSLRTDREFSALPDGLQHFVVEARDSLGRVSSMAPLVLQITPPWFRSKIAYLSYVISALFALWLASKLGSQRRQRLLLNRQQELEATVQTRTQELAEKNLQLAEQATRLEEVDRLKTRFFINVGHEFRTPLTLVLGPVDDLLRDVKERFSSKAREQLELVQRNAKRVLDLIVELLDINRFEHGQLRLHLQPSELTALIARVAEEARPLMTRFGHTLTTKVPQAPLWARVDALHLERAIANLLSNAAKYMRRGGAVALSLDLSADQLEIQVSDAGRGIALQALAHVFDRFYQAEGGDQASGYGIGLALVREIIEAHGGSIRVVSTQGVGSTFSILLGRCDAAELLSLAAQDFQPVTLPRADQPDAEHIVRAESESALTATTSDNRVRVLVVDDHADLRARLKHLLSTQYQVFEAADGPSALLAIQQHLPDVVVCDVMMPGFDGVELCRRVRADPDVAAIGLLLLTAKVGTEHAVAGLNAGANDYLAKPFDASELLARVGALVAHAMRLRVAAAQRVPAMPSFESAVETAQPVNMSDAKWQQRLDAVIAARLAEPLFDIEALALAMHSDRSTLFRRCKLLFDKPPGEYLRMARLQQAHSLLAQAAASVSEIGFAVGFENLSSFTRAFKAHFGYAPSQTLAQSPGPGPAQLLARQKSN